MVPPAGCFRGAYFQLAKQFKSAHLSPYVNYWHQIHDFTKNSDGLNYTLTGETPSWVAEFIARKPDDVAHVQVDLDPVGATVPLTAGPTASVDGSGAATLAVAFSQKHARALLQAVLESASDDTTLVSTNEVKLGDTEVDKLFATSETAEFKKVSGLSRVHGRAQHTCLFFAPLTVGVYLSACTCSS